MSRRTRVYDEFYQHQCAAGSQDLRYSKADWTEQDPAGVKALLDQLRSSQAWQETVAQSTVTNGHPANLSPSVNTKDSEAATTSTPRSTVAALLSQLQATASPTNVDPPDIERPTAGLAPEQHSTASPSRTRNEDLTSLTFQQALPALAQLAEDASFVSLITQAGPLRFWRQHHILTCLRLDEGRAGGLGANALVRKTGYLQKVRGQGERRTD
jgi:hypothetical protein